MPRIFKGSESELRLLLSRSQETLTDIKIKLYTTNLEDAIEVIDGIAVEGDTAVISLAPRAFIGMEDGVVNYIVEAKVEGQSYYMERQSNYMLRSLSYINESGVASTTLEITQNGDYRVTPNDGLYVDIDVNVPVPVILDKDTLTLKSGDSGVYTTPQNYDAVKTLEYDVLPPNILGTDKITIKAGEKKTYTAPDEYDGIESLTIEAVPNQDMEVTITDNGEYTYMSDTDYSGIGVFKANVEVPIQEKAEVFNDNGDYTIVPDENYVAMRRINVKVDYKPKPVIPNGISFTGYEYNNFDEGTFEDKDWSKVYDCSGMFESCSYLMHMDVYPKDVNILGARRMFYATNLKSFPDDWDLSNCLTCREMFDGCNFVDKLRPLNLRSCVDARRMFAQCQTMTTVTITDCENLLNTYEMFYGCYGLTAVTMNNTPNLLITKNMFYNCNKLTTVNGLSTENVRDMTFMFYNCHKLKSIELDISNCLRLQQIFYYCTDLTEVRFKGNPTKLNLVSNMFQGANKTGTLYYPAEYADAYQKIIDVLPTTWTAVGE